MSDTSDEQPKPASGLLRSSGIVGAMTMVSRVLGLIRDVVIATIFGAGTGADAFFVAFKIPNFLRRLFAEGAFSQAFVPVLSEYRTQRSVADVRALVNAVSGTLGLTLLLLSVVGVLAAPAIITLFAPGFHQDTEKLELATSLLRITFPYIFLISMTAFAGAVLNSYGRFAIPAITPVWLNLSLIGSALLMSSWFAEPTMALAWGVVIAGVVQLVFQFPFIRQLGLFPRPVVAWHDPGVRRILKLMVPALFAVSVTQLNLLLDTILASFLPTGSVSWLYYSDRLSELPLGVFGIAIATVILPSLSRKHAGDNREQFAATLDWAVRAVALIGLPASVALVALSDALVATLFQYGALTEFDVVMAAKSLRAYALGLLAFMLVKVLAPGFFARQDMRTPVRIAVIAMVANMGLNLLFLGLIWLGIRYLQVDWSLHTGLALATSASAFLNAGLLYHGLRKRDVFRIQPGWGRFSLQLLAANAALLVFLLGFNVSNEVWFGWDWSQRALRMSGLVVGGIATYVTLLLLAGIRPRDFYHRGH